MTDDARRTRREGLAELAEDAVGFGGQELRLTRDLLLRPRAVMDAYDAGGSTAGPRPCNRAAVRPVNTVAGRAIERATADTTALSHGRSAAQSLTLM